MVEDTSTLGVGGVVQLEAAVEAEAVDEIGSHATADAVGGLEDRDLDTVPSEIASSSQPGQPRSHDDDSHGGQVSPVNWIRTLRTYLFL
jgi:hypothetical protein